MHFTRILIFLVGILLLTPWSWAVDIEAGKQRAATCFACHGVLKQEGGLRLDAVELMTQGGDSGEVVVPGQVAASVLVDRVSADDPTERMPPEGAPLTPEEIVSLSAWIEAGMPVEKEEDPGKVSGI